MRGRAVAIWVAGALGCALVARDPLQEALLVAALGFVVVGCAGWRRGRPLLLGVAVAGILAVVVTLCFNHVAASTVLFALPPGWILIGGAWTLEAVAYGVSSALVLAAAVLAVAPLSLLLDAAEVVDALPRGLDRTGAVIASSLTLLPALARSARETEEAQRLRGLRTSRTRSWLEVMVPVLLTSIEDSLQLAEAMAARGYGAGRRTHFPVPPVALRDLAPAVAAILALVIVIGLRVTGTIGGWAPFPTLTPPTLSPLEVLPPLLLLLPVLRWRRSPSPG